MSAILASVPASSVPAPAPHLAPDVLRVDLQQHNVCFVLPVGATLAGDLDLPGGALIYGSVKGRIRCAEGSLVFAQGSSFCGKAEAPMIYVCGTVRSVGSSEPSDLRGALMIAVSSTAVGRATLTSRQFAIHSKTFAGTMRSLE
ncbi:polymer-forming cytoskeletal protein [Ramlibacter sp. AN1133]|uniref:polymer-forming cytoskeletal protein n=1 Tax=Ramlibacter sp. AN1133 TaxID=3133429 RepID=UPI0030BD61CD